MSGPEEGEDCPTCGHHKETEQERLNREEVEHMQKCEDADAAAFENAAHGYDFDEDHKTDPNTGMSEYDFDPGVSYNDAGEPKGYM